ncbi:MAG: CapA family protein [Leptospira sp.]|nr:CapA family protein [Leptospira sp.]
MCIYSDILPDRTPEPIEVEVNLPVSELYRFKTESGTGYRFPNTYKIWVAGDVMFNWGVRDSMKAEDPLFAFRSFSFFLQNFDYRMLNLETPILKKTPNADSIKSYVFYGERNDLNLLKFLGIDAVFLGNNHTMDFGEEGLKDTLDLLDEFKISHSGAGLNQAESLKPIVIPKDGVEYRVFSFSDTGETRLFSSLKTPGAAYFRVGTAEKLIQKSKSNQTNILSVHWGVEYSPYPTEEQRKAAKYLVGAGYKVILGHHPHVPQGIEVFSNGVVIYSLGNFLFGSKNQYLKHNITAVLHFAKEKLIAVEVIPVFGKHQSGDGLHYFYPLGPNEAENFLKEYAVLCKQLGTNLIVSGGRGYVFLEEDPNARLNP